ncbi:MAG: hypothetical protein Q4D79_00185 [Propionibacteriaceae bacterium]|nr:hypothetical protein [Propionibacteriaceae bacterium]
MGRRDTNHFPRQTARICHDLAWHVIRTGPASLWIGRAWQADGSEHQTGRAVDIIVSGQVGRLPTPSEKAAGDLLAAWLTRHARQLHIRHVIWNAQIWKTRYASQGWQPLSGPRSGLSDWHRDHVHVLMQDADGSVPADPITSTTTQGDDMPLTQTDLNNIASTTDRQVWGAAFGSRKAGEIFREMADDAERSRVQLVHTNERIDELEAKIDRILDLLTPDRATE